MNAKKIVSLMILVMFLLSFAPCWADSKTVTLRVTCTIVPMMEMTAPQRIPQISPQTVRSNFKPPERELLGLNSIGPVVQANSNLNGHHRLSEGFRKGPEGLVKVYSVTAV